MACRHQLLTALWQLWRKNMPRRASQAAKTANASGQPAVTEYQLQLLLRQEQLGVLVTAAAVAVVRSRKKPEALDTSRQINRERMLQKARLEMLLPGSKSLLVCKRSLKTNSKHHMEQHASKAADQPVQRQLGATARKQQQTRGQHQQQWGKSMTI
jgi:hypothetical protein